jgi:hypothetical protein
VVVIAAAVTVPQVVKMPIEPAKNEAGSSATSSTPSATGGAIPEASNQAPIPLPSGNPVPPNFQPSSVTFVSGSTGYVIGQAGAPGQCATQYCTSVARTQDAGGTWTGLPAPLAGAPDGATGVGQIRFLDGINGWAFGPELWATHDGGENWKKIGTQERRVIDVETVGARAFAIEARCTGSGTAFAADCTSFTLYSTPATTNDWTQVGASTTGLTTGSAGAAALMLTGTRGYLLGPGGTLFAGPVDGGTWQAAGKLPCAVGLAQQDGSPAGALLAAVNAQNLVLACTQTAAGDTEAKTLYVSSDGGKSWQQTSSGPAAGVATSVTATFGQTLLLATDQGIEVQPAGGGWRAATLTAAAPATGFSFIGMTTLSNGVALPASPADGTVWFTTDGGLTWTPATVQGGD